MKKFFFLISFLSAISFVSFSQEFYNGCLYEVSPDNEATITMFFYNPAIIPVSINGYPVTEIDSSAISTIPRNSKVVLEKDHPFFYIENDILYSKKDNSLIYSFSKEATVFIPYGIERIRGSAFSSLELENVIIPDSVTDIDEFAFRNCWNLKVLHISKYVKQIGQCAFPRGCKVTLFKNPYFEIQDGLLIEIENKRIVYSFSDNQNVIIPEDIRIIEGFAFADQYNLKTIEISSSVIIEPWAFYGNNSLETVVFKDAYSQIKEHAFEGCSALKEITLPTKLKKIENNTFCLCNSLEHIDLPSSLEGIYPSAFSNCNNLIEIQIPSNVNYIGDDAIPANTRIVLDNNNNFILKDGLLLDAQLKTVIYCSNTVEKVIIPDSVEIIYFGVFSDCIKLQEIFIPNSVSIIFGNYPEKTLIKCNKDSAAHKWCITEKHIFELVD